MSRLPDANVADAARKAGFSGDGLVEATAAAFQASGNIPGYDHPLWPGPAAHYKGLWGVDVVQWPEIADRDLHNPHVAARAAYELTERVGDLSWCPAWRAGIHPTHLAAAKLVANMIPAPYAYADPVLVYTHEQRVRHALDRLEPARRALDMLPMMRG